MSTNLSPYDIAVLGEPDDAGGEVKIRKGSKLLGLLSGKNQSSFRYWSEHIFSKMRLYLLIQTVEMG